MYGSYDYFNNHIILCFPINIVAFFHIYLIHFYEKASRIFPKKRKEYLREYNLKD